jgi:hypothetical protein
MASPLRSNPSNLCEKRIDQVSQDGALQVIVSRLLGA